MNIPGVPQADHLGKYRLDGIIGQGAMGVVYKGFDEDIERQVAVKVLHSHLLDQDMGDELAVRFRLEAKAAARCMHTNIVTVFDYGVIADNHYIVMEYVAGIDLKSLLRQEKKLPFRQASDTIFQVLSALGHAHHNGVVHRDIKPANIMLLDNGQIKVADFGIARLVSSDLTQTGCVIGTPAYMSPEGRLGDVVDSRSDLYSVGVVFYEILTGKRIDLVVPDNSALRKDIGEVIGDAEMAKKTFEILLKVLQKNQALRFSDAANFADALGSVLSPGSKHVPDNETLAATVLNANRQPIAGLPAEFDGLHHSGDKALDLTPSMIERVEEVLARYVGPLASLLVKKYLKQCSSVDTLLDALAGHIPNTAEQTRFRTLLGATMTVSGGGNSHSADAAVTELLSNADVQQISTLLAQYIGPLASRIVNRAQRNAVSNPDFCDRLAKNIPVENERIQFLQQLDRLLSDE